MQQYVKTAKKKNVVPKEFVELMTSSLKRFEPQFIKKMGHDDEPNKLIAKMFIVKNEVWEANGFEGFGHSIVTSLSRTYDSEKVVFPLLLFDYTLIAGYFLKDYVHPSPVNKHTFFPGDLILPKEAWYIADDVVEHYLRDHPKVYKDDNLLEMIGTKSH